MSRINENLKDKLLDEACKQIDTIGYGAMTMQSISKACGVAVGTVYNYYSSNFSLHFISSCRKKTSNIYSWV